MKVARARKEDVDVIYDLLGALDRIKDGESFEEDEESEGIGWCELQDALDAGEDDYVPDKVNHYIRQAMKHLLDACHLGNGMRAVMNLSALLEPENEVVDPESSILDLHPNILKSLADTERLDFIEKIINIDGMVKRKMGKGWVLFAEYDLSEPKPLLRDAIDAAMQAEAKAT